MSKIQPQELDQKSNQTTFQMSNLSINGRCFVKLPKFNLYSYPVLFRWLIANRKFDQARDLMQQAAKKNKVS